MQTFALEELQKEGIAMDQVAALASIDLKQGEMGLETLACFFIICPFIPMGQMTYKRWKGSFPSLPLSHM